jgi:hypothetical protein
VSKISELSDGGSLISSDYLIAVRSGGNVKVRMDQINVDQVDLGDNEFIRLGNSQDLTMVHTSTQSIINQAGIGDLLLQRAGATKLTINASGIDVTGSVTTTGNVGIGTVPNSWGSTYEALSVGPWSTLGTFSNADGGFLVGNAYHDGTNWKYRNNGTAEQYKFLYGAHVWEYAASGTAGNTISFSEAMRIDASGSVGIGNSAPLGKLTISNAAGTNAPTTVTAANTYLQLGSDDYGPSNNGKFMIGFGFTDATNTNSPAYIGYEEASTSGDTYGDLTFYTRSVTTDTAPTERMRIDSAGNVGIGTSSPLNATNQRSLSIDAVSFPRVDLYVGTVHTARLVGGTANTSLGTVTSSPLVFNTTDLERMRIDALGNVGIGTTLPSQLLHLRSATPAIEFDDSGFATVRGRIYSNEGNLLFEADYNNARANSNIAFEVDGAERMRIDSSGNLLVNATAAVGGARLEVTEDSGNLVYFKNSAGTGLYMVAGGTAWVSASDERIKDIIEPISGAVNKLSSLRTVIGKYKTDQEGVRRPFLIAQDLQAVFPEAVNEQEDELKTLGVEYSSLVPLLIAGMNEQQATIEALTARIAALES